MTAPKLRFKKDDGSQFPEWGAFTLEKIRDSKVRWSITGGPFGSNLKAEDYTEAGVRIIQLQNIGDGVFNDSYKIYTSQEKADELLSCNIYPGEIIISKMGDPVARCCFIPSNGVRYLMASDGIRLAVDVEKFDKRYVHDYINSDFFRKNAIENSTGSTRKRIGLYELKKIPVNAPCIEEQQKIGRFLELMNEKISLLTKKKLLLEEYKKGVMQKIFNQEIRFKDEGGGDFPGWTTVRLQEMADFFRGGQLAKSHLDLSGKNKCIHYGELFTVYSETISEVKSRTNISDGFIGQQGDIVMPSSDVTPDGLARASCLMIDGVILGGDMNIIRSNNRINSPMLSYLLNFNKKKIIELVSGTTVKHIYIKDMKNIEITIPSSLEEQLAISNFLIALDKKIEGIKTQIELSKQYKKGLLQQMFV
jgi:type I restriction enzyme S subunit